jgi:hypothetical protein
MKGLGHDRFQRLRFAMLIVVIVYNLSESMFARLSPIWFTTLLVFVDFPYLKKGLKKKPASLHHDQDHVALATVDLPQWQTTSLNGQ